MAPGFTRTVFVLLALVGCATVGVEGANGKPKAPTRTAVTAPRSGTGKARVRQVLRGKATYYADSLAGNRTASGERYNPSALTGAHRKLPFGTRVRVTREDTGDSVELTINDRGPFGNAERIIDVSRAAAEKLNMLRAGVVRVRVEVLR